MRTDPQVAIAATKYCKAASSLDPKKAEEDGVVNLATMTLSEALNKRWDTDAHMVCYQVRQGRQVLAQWPRILKSLLNSIRANEGNVEVSVFLVDYDNPDHSTWNDDNLEQFASRVVAAVSEAPQLGEYRCSYATKHGARFVYVLDTPISVEDAECYHRGLVQLWQRNGLPVDPRCSDWTRLFRLPNVRRGDVNTWEQDYPLETEYQDEAVLDLDLIEKIRPQDRVNQYAEIVPVTDDQPDPSEAADLLWTLSKTGRTVMTDWQKLAKRRLKGRDCYGCMFEDEPIAEQGSRTDTLQRYIGSAVGMLYGVEDYITPAHIYGLFLDPVMQLEEDEGTPDWSDSLWTSVCRYWEGEDAQYRAAQEVKEDREKHAVSVQHAMLQGAREWGPEIRELRGDDREAYGWLQRHFIAVMPSGHCAVMRPDGYYDRLHVRKDTIRLRLRSWGLEDVIDLNITSLKGDQRPMKGQEIIDRYGFMVHSVEGIACGQGSYISGLDNECPKLMVRLYGRRNDLEPKFNSHVDRWMRLFFGDSYEDACQWVGQALAFDEGPITSLSYNGEPGSGKKLFVMGLAESIDTGSVVSGGAFAKFNGEIMNSPFVVINEGWEKGNGLKDRADTFRHLVSGDPIMIEEKFQTKIIARVPLRVVMTANNIEVVSQVFSHRDMSPADRKALVTRIFHVEGDNRAVQWLRMKGGPRFTGRKGQRWIAGDAGQPSDFILARHFLWLYTNRKAPALGSRLLMDGKMPDFMIRSMATRTGSSPIIVETLVCMIEARGHTGASIDKNGGRVHVTTKSVLDYWRDHFADRTVKKLTVQTVARVLDGFVFKEDRSLTSRDTPKGPIRARWREIDLKLLLQEAHEHGYPCGTLEGLTDTYDAARNQSRVI